jgi:transposase
MENSPSQTINTVETVTIPLAEYQSLISQNAELLQKVDWLMAQFRLSKNQKFGQSSEQSGYLQFNFFNEAEATADVNVVEPELTEIKKHYRRKSKDLPDRLPADLPIETVIHDLPENERGCPECGCAMHVMGKEERQELKLIPAQASIIKHVRNVYACRNCEKDECGVPIVKSPVDEPVIKGSFASPEAVAHIMTQKFEMGSPLYRQEQEWNRNGIMLSRQTMSNWLIRASEDWLEPIYEMLREIMLMNDVLHADETVLQVLKEPGKLPTSDSYMWLYRTGWEATAHVILFEYQPDRSAKRPKEFLDGYKGYLHTDGYSCYHGLSSDIIVVGCLSHIRRRFVQALKSLKPDGQAGSLAIVGKDYCDRLFAIERGLAEKTTDERYVQRMKVSKPLLMQFKSWLDSVNLSTKTTTGEAVRYARNQFNYLQNYMLDGRLEISNNRAEVSIKPFVIDRKNFLFANTPRGAKSSAVIFSLIQTARENGMNAYDYLTHIFHFAPNNDIKNNPDALQQLMPWDPVCQRYCRKIPTRDNTDGPT